MKFLFDDESFSFEMLRAAGFAPWPTPSAPPTSRP
jgi:hypothetical protein